MTKRTKTIFIIAVLYSVVLALMLASILYVIHMQGTKLGEAKDAIAEHTAKELAYNNVMRVLASSEQDRAKLSSYFISEKDTISFITELESAAKSFGVTMQTTGLSVAPAATVAGVSNPPVLSVGVQFKGDEQSVKNYIVLLENVPYHKRISSFTFSGDSTTGQWSAATTLAITMKP
jgi:hypothetical protein